MCTCTIAVTTQNLPSQQGHVQKCLVADPLESRLDVLEEELQGPEHVSFSSKEEPGSCCLYVLVGAASEPSSSHLLWLDPGDGFWHCRWHPWL